MTIDQFTKSSSPITIIVNISNPAAIKLAKILVDQGSKLLIVDKLTSAKRKLLGDLLSRPDCLFMDAESTFRNIEKFKKIDYIYYFMSQLTTGSMFPEMFAESMEIVQLSHKDFLKESNRVDAYIKLSAEFDAAFTLITSAYVSQFLEAIPEANLQLQKYAESLVLDYVERNRLNGRIVRIGELIGKENDLSSPTNVARLTRELLLRDKINIFGDGLQQNYIVHTEDAVYAILKAAFASEAKGRTFVAAYTHPFTSLSIAYQLLELTTDEKQVVFNEVLPHYEDIAKLKDMCLAPSVSALGWDPQIPFEQAIAETVESLAASLKQPWSSIEKPVVAVQTREQGVKEDVQLESDKKVAKLVKQKSSHIHIGANIASFFGQVYEKVIAQPLLALYTFPKQLSIRYAKSAETVKQASARTIIFAVIFVIVAFFVTPYVHASYMAYRLYSIATNLKKDITSLNGDHFDTYADQLPVYAAGLKSDLESLSYLESVPIFKEQYQETRSLVTAVNTYAQSMSRSLKAASPAMKIAKGLATARPNNPSGTVSRDYYNEITDIMANQQQFVQAVQDAKIGSMQLKRVNTAVYPGFIRTKIESATALLSEYTTATEQASQFYDLLPYFLGYKDRRNYFLLIQNETEIRATGGWFTNYAIVGIENGQVRQFTISDVYDTDGKINGIEAPADMQKALQIKMMKIATSNWDPELKVVTQNVADILKQTGIAKPNDVTMTVNFAVVQDLLRITGPVSVEGLGDVTADNLNEKVGTLHTQFVPGSQEKTKVVSTFFPQFLNKAIATTTDQKMNMISALQSSLQKHDIMLYSTDPQVQSRLFTPNNTAVQLYPVDSPLMTVDWNYGGNKANMFLKRITEIDIDEEKKTVSYTVSYTNESKTDTYPEGNYFAAQRIYYPQEFAYSNASGFTNNPQLYTTTSGIPYILGNLEVDKNTGRAVTANFVLRKLPSKLSLVKQPGQSSEIVRVSITPATKSQLSADQMRSQEFSETNGKWLKTYVRTSDIVVRLQ